jgi:hypothetical protein
MAATLAKGAYPSGPKAGQGCWKYERHAIEQHAIEGQTPVAA